jgi:SAM-dependent methyltransferase
MTDPAPFEPWLVRQRKRRARATYTQARFLLDRAAEDLADRLDLVQRNFERTLSLGGYGVFEAAIARRPALAARVGRIEAPDLAVLDLERPDYEPASFKLIVSTLALHWVNDLPGFFVQARRMLQPDGLFLASFFGGATLNELRLALIEAEAEITGGAGPRVAPFADLQDIGSLLQRAGFALPTTDRDVVTVRYGEPMRLLADLRAMGETSALRQRSPKALSRRILARTFEIYRARHGDADGRVAATFEIVTATGWAPHESQQKPLRPGSAKTRLSDALGVTEHGADDKAGS